MADIGDAVTIRTLITDDDDTPVNPTTVTLTVTDPAGADTTPAVSNPTVGTFEASITVNAAGRWRYLWATTGPENREFGHLDVKPDPPGRLLPLATTNDLEAILGRDLTATELARAPGLLHSASTKVRAACQKQQFIRVDDDSAVLTPIGHTIRLPQRPVIDVTSVAAIAREGGADVPLTGWSWDGLDEIDLDQAAATSPAGNWWGDIGKHVNRYRVVYSHGYDVIPDTLVDVTAQSTLRVLATSAPEGMTQRSIGQYAEQYQQATGSPGNSPWLSRAEKQQLVDDGFRRTTHTRTLRQR